MNIPRGTKIIIHDYYKESLEAPDDNENVIPNRNLIGRRRLRTPIEIDSEDEPIAEFNNTNLNTSSEIGRKSSSFDLLLKSLLTASENSSYNSNKDTETLTEEVNNKNNELSFEELMNKILTPNIPLLKSNERGKSLKTKHFKEISTQTSFEEILTPLVTPNSSQNSDNKQEKGEKSREIDKDVTLIDNIPDIFSQNLNSIKELNETIIDTSYIGSENVADVTSVNLTSITANRLFQRNTQKSKIPVQKSPETLEKINILDILAEDITMPLSKIKFNNIRKIGTDKWLQFALNIVGKLHEQKKYRNNIHNVVLDYNTYTANNTRRSIKRSRKGRTRICRMENIESNNNFVSRFESYTSEENFSASTTKGKVEQKLKFGVNQISKDKNLVDDDIAAIPEINKDKIKAMINDLLVKLFVALQNGKIPVLMPRRRGITNCIFKDGRLQLKPLAEAPLKRLPMYCKYSGLKFCRMLYIMGKTYSLLENDTTLTKREVFYQIKHLLKNQGQLNNTINDVTCLLNVGQWQLNLVSHCGLVYGDLKLVWSSGEVTNCNVPATMIPYNLDDIVEVQTAAYFILVVEKESIYHKLIEEDLPNKLARPFIMITGKGVPDFATQRFLKKMCIMMALPVFILVDADIYGIKIMLNYRFGSTNSAYLSQYLAIPNARWLGVFPSEIMKFGMQYLEITAREKKLTKNVLKYPFIENYPQIKEELEIIISTKKKASIEGLIKNNTFLSESYLPTKFFNQDFI